MCAGPGVVDGDLCDAGDGGGGVDGAVCVQVAAVPVVGVLAEADVAGDVEVGEGGAEFLDCLDDGAVLVVCGTSMCVLT